MSTTMLSTVSALAVLEATLDLSLEPDLGGLTFTHAATVASKCAMSCVPMNSV